MAKANPFQESEESADDTVRRALHNDPTATPRLPLRDGRETHAGGFRYSDSPYAIPAAVDTSFAAPPSFVEPQQHTFTQQGTFGPPRYRAASDELGASGPLADLESAVGTGSSGRSRADMLSPTARRADEFIDGVFDAAALNPLVSVASPLLWLAARLNESAAPDDLRVFRDRVVDEIRRFESAAMARGLPNRAILVARYALCATIDDIILNTVWAGQAQWAARSLVSLLYGETWGGERVFELLQQLVQTPDENIDILELLAICLSIGFVGKYRVMEDGQSALNRLRSELYRIIRRVRGSYERDLAPAWRGAEIAYRPMAGPWRFWAPVLGALLLLAAFYLVLRLNLEARIDDASQRIAALVPRDPIAVPKPEMPPLPRPVRPPSLTQVQRISALLQREIADHRVEVVGAPDTVMIRLPTSSFASAAAVLPASEAPMLQHIATALNPEPGPILVTGYTDNVRPLPTNAIKTNLDLSNARAASVAAMLKPMLAAPDRISTNGRGEADPIASNATAEGRARNRRVDIQIPAEGAAKAVGSASSPATAPSVGAKLP